MLLLLQMVAGRRSGTSGTSRGSQKPRQVLGHWHEGGDHRYFDDDDPGDEIQDEDGDDCYDEDGNDTRAGGIGGPEMIMRNQS